MTKCVCVHLCVCTHTHTRARAGDADVEDRLAGTVGEGEGGMNGESAWKRELLCVK